MLKKAVSVVLTSLLIMSAVSTGSFSATADDTSELPSSIDLRNYNGKNYVTPVKLQTPFGTCWAFGAAAAAESSYLFANDLGVAAGEQNNNANFSEKYISWYVYHPITADEVSKGRVRSSQVGEGLDVSEPERDNPNVIYYFGGSHHTASNLFSAGFYPVDESVTVNGDTPYYYSGKERLRSETNPGYSEADDWSLPLNAEYMNAPSNAFLRESRTLPSPNVRNTDGSYSFSEEGLNAIKSEISQGHSVCVGIYMFGDNILKNTNWSQYCYSPYTSNHDVTIVGYDDNYPKENFAIKNSSGKLVTKSVPPANGAFIVKNSLGSLTDEDRATATTDAHGRTFYENPNANPGGIDDSGYFYLSYYDQSIDDPLRFEFDNTSSVKYKTQNFDQYDMMISALYANSDYSSETKTANVFDAEEDEYLYQISYYTNTPDTTVNYEIYKSLANDNPESGILLESGSHTHKYSGSHKIDLSGEYSLKKGEKYSVVLTMKYNKDNQETYTSVFPFMFNLYNTKIKGVINEGESYFYSNGSWSDAADLKQSLIDQAYQYCTDTPKFAPLLAMTFDGKSGFDVDNYPIKAISVPASLHTDQCNGNHNWDEGTITLSPTCTENGIKEFTCTVCGATRTETIPATGHQWGNWVSIIDVETSEEIRERMCTICAETERISVPEGGTDPSTNPTENSTGNTSGTPEGNTTGNTTNNSTTGNNNSTNTLSGNSDSSSNAPETGDVNYLMILTALLLSGFSGVSAGRMLLKRRSRKR